MQYVVYDKTSGAVLRSGTCQPEDLENQVRGRPNEGVMETTTDAIVVVEINLDPVRESLYMKIDADAEAIRSKFITPGSGQAMTYLTKQLEAAAYQANPNVPVPFLEAEAVSTETTVADLAQVVLDNAAAWAVTGAKIEAARRCAKINVEQAVNIAQMHEASTINWDIVLAG